MSTVAELEINGEIFEQIDRERDAEDDQKTDDGKTQVESELSLPAEQSRLDSVKKLSSGIYHTASDALGYGMDSVKRAATGLGAGLTRAGQNVADKIQKSPKIPKSMKKRTEIDDLSSSGLLNDSDDDDDREGESSTLVSRKSSKEMAARKKRQDALRKERE
ncbi:uncharacterized protein [Diadema antillarum]|uniref:uncharacterized protein n=1 Tax=Diadema antillarum TaxID=105358 RepID=UPI003A86A20C